MPAAEINSEGDTGFDAGKKIKGRKRHSLVDTLGIILKTEVHPTGQDRDGAALVFDKLTTRFLFIEKIYDDGGYEGPIVQQASPRPMEIVKRNQKGSEVLPKRWIVERTFGSASTAACQRILSASPKPASPSAKQPLKSS